MSAPLARLSSHPGARRGLAMIGAFLLLGLLGPLFTADAREPLAVPLQPPSWAHWLGTTGQGQDVLAQLVAGTRASLFAGLLIGAATVAAGAAVGLVAGYFGGWLDELLSLLVNVVLVLPGLPLAVVLAAYLPAGAGSMALVLVLTGWAWHARVVRAQTLTLRGRDFVAAAAVAGEGPLRLIFVELLPNLASLLVSQLIGATTYAIGAQVGLEFLGLGDVDAVTWGTNLYWASNDQALLTRAWWTFVPTGLAIALVGFALTSVAGAVDEFGNPRLFAERRWRRELARLGVRATEDTPVRRPHG
jgi:peptide/nickel transport system permease protein